MVLGRKAGFVLMFQCFVSYGLRLGKLSYGTQCKFSEMGNVYNSLIFLPISGKRKRADE